MEVIHAYIDYIAAGAGILAVVCIVLTIAALAANGSLKRKFRKWKSIHETADLDKVYEQTLEAVADLRKQLADAEHRMDVLQAKLQKKVSTARVKRYNAFSDTGSDLSYSVALLDDELNGVVLSSIYGRDESRTYAKPVFSGDSEYTLTEEENEVIHSTEQPHRHPVGV